MNEEIDWTGACPGVNILMELMELTMSVGQLRDVILSISIRLMLQYVHQANFRVGYQYFSIKVGKKSAVQIKTEAKTVRPVTISTKLLSPSSLP